MDYDDATVMYVNPCESLAESGAGAAYPYIMTL